MNPSMQMMFAVVLIVGYPLSVAAEAFRSPNTDPVVIESKDRSAN